MSLGGSARAKVRPSAVAVGASDRERVVWLERYVEQLDRDLDGMWAIERRASEVLAEAAKRDEQFRQELGAQTAEQRAKLRPSLRRQAIGAVCILAGLVLGTIGNVS